MQIQINNRSLKCFLLPHFPRWCFPISTRYRPSLLTGIRLCWAITAISILHVSTALWHILGATLRLFMKVTVSGTERIWKNVSWLQEYLFWTIVCDKTLLQANPVSIATFLPVQLHPSLYRKPSQLVSENNNDKSRTLCKLVFCPCHHNMPKARFDVVLILLRVLLS